MWTRARTQPQASIGEFGCHGRQHAGTCPSPASRVNSICARFRAFVHCYGRRDRPRERGAMATAGRSTSFGATSRGRKRAARLRAARRLARRDPARRARPPPAGRRGRLPQPRHHLRRLWRGGSGRADHPVRHHPAHLLRRRMGAGSPPGSSSGCGRSTPSSTTSMARAGSSPTASIPADIVLGNPQYCIPLAGARPPHGVYAHICGIDLVRTGADEFFVLEDNARTPSGVSYMLENREAMLRLCPELFDIFPVRPVDSYPELLRDTLYSVAPGGARDAGCVLLTPGHFNSAFYEHSFLADNMGIELVEGTRPRGRRRHRLDADDRRPGAGRRHLPADRRRLPRSARLPPRQRCSACRG